MDAGTNFLRNVRAACLLVAACGLFSSATLADEADKAADLNLWVSGAPAHLVFEQIAELTGRQAVVDSAVVGQVSGRFSGSLEDTLRAVAEQLPALVDINDTVISVVSEENRIVSSIVLGDSVIEAQERSALLENVMPGNVVDFREDEIVVSGHPEFVRRKARAVTAALADVEQVSNEKDAQAVADAEELDKKQDAAALADVEQANQEQDSEALADVEQADEEQDSEALADVEQVDEEQDSEALADVEQVDEEQDAEALANVEQVNKGQDAEALANVEQANGEQDTPALTAADPDADQTADKSALAAIKNESQIQSMVVDQSTDPETAALANLPSDAADQAATDSVLDAIESAQPVEDIASAVIKTEIQESPAPVDNRVAIAAPPTETSDDQKQVIDAAVAVSPLAEDAAQLPVPLPAGTEDDAPVVPGLKAPRALAVTKPSETQTNSDSRVETSPTVERAPRKIQWVTDIPGFETF